MKLSTNKYVCVIIPTVEGKYLDVIINHYLKLDIGQIIIAWHRDSEMLRDEIRPICTSGENVHHLLCQKKGQVQQRNEAYNIIDDRIKFVLHNDDDLLISGEALGKAVGRLQHNEFQAITITKTITTKNFTSGRAGSISSFGYNYYFCQSLGVNTTQWVSGGKTLWQRDVLTSYKPLPRFTNWAVGEDVHFSSALSHLKYGSLHVKGGVTTLEKTIGMQSIYRKNTLVLQTASYLYNSFIQETTSPLLCKLFLILYILLKVRRNIFSRHKFQDALKALCLIFKTFIIPQHASKQYIERILMFGQLK